MSSRSQASEVEERDHHKLPVSAALGSAGLAAWLAMCAQK